MSCIRAPTTADSTISSRVCELGCSPSARISSSSCSPPPPPPPLVRLAGEPAHPSFGGGGGGGGGEHIVLTVLHDGFLPLRSTYL